MSRLNYGRYAPEPVTPEEHSALRSEFWVMVFLVGVMLLATFAEPLMDLAEAALGAK
jgi:hypothetical protein